MNNKALCSMCVLLAALSVRASGQNVISKPPADGAVAKLIAQLGADDFRTREQASKELVKLGSKILPALQKAARGNLNLEVRRRIQQVAVRIEDILLEAEDKPWKGLDGPRRGIKERLVRILRKSSSLSDAQVTSAIYLLTVGRSATAEEARRDEKSFAESHTRLVPVLRIARSLIQSKEFKADIATANGRILDAQKDLAGETLAKQLHRLNGAEYQKLTDEVAAALNKSVKNDRQVIDLAYLLALSRFPQEEQADIAAKHITKTKERVRGIADLVWAMTNTREFMQLP